MRHFTLTHPCRLLVVLVSLLTLTACGKDGKDKDNVPSPQDNLWQIESIRWGDTQFKYQYDHKGRVSSISYSSEGKKPDIMNITYSGSSITFQTNSDQNIGRVDDSGRVISISEKYSIPTEGEQQSTSSFGYDKEGRMIYAKHDDYADTYTWDGDLLLSVTEKMKDGSVYIRSFSYTNIDNVAGVNGVIELTFSSLYRGFFGKTPAKLPASVRVEFKFPYDPSSSGMIPSYTSTFHYTLDKRNRPIRIETTSPDGTEDDYEDDPPVEITYVVK